MKYNNIIISRLIKLKKKECPAVYEMYKNKSTKQSIISIIHDYIISGKASNNIEAINAVELYYT